jgi:hypothetical protein
MNYIFTRTLSPCTHSIIINEKNNSLVRIKEIHFRRYKRENPCPQAVLADGVMNPPQLWHLRPRPSASLDFYFSKLRPLFLSSLDPRQHCGINGLKMVLFDKGFRPRKKSLVHFLYVCNI